MPPRQIILGRVVGLWTRFLPSAMMLLVFHFTLTWDRWNEPYYEIQRGLDLPSVFNKVFIYLSLPFFTTYAALRVRWVLVGMAVSWLGVALASALAGHAVGLCFGYMSDGEHDVAFVFFFGLSCLAAVRLVYFLIHHSLSRRIYSF
jgi:hypothetical protein